MICVAKEGALPQPKSLHGLSLHGGTSGNSLAQYGYLSSVAYNSMDKWLVFIPALYLILQLFISSKGILFSISSLLYMHLLNCP